MKNTRLTTFSRVLCLIGSVALTIAIFVPLWRIELDAPQYPEGLGLSIYPNKIAGDVEIINGLNHYIGMKTLHTEDFIEFTLLPYLIGFFALLALVVAVVGKRLWLNVLFILFLIFGIVSMIDFWRWEYDYGHNLDPNAAIKVPGMAYQPPLIGFKQLLNFGAYSIPDLGGWLFIVAGLLFLAALLKENNWIKKTKKHTALLLLPLGILLVNACNSNTPEPIQLHTDKCDYCQMAISDGRFAAETITKKGRIYKFDDVSCMVAFAKENPDYRSLWVANYGENDELIECETAFWVQTPNLKSPMGGNTAAFAEKMAAESFSKENETQVLDFKTVFK